MRRFNMRALAAVLMAAVLFAAFAPGALAAEEPYYEYYQQTGALRGKVTLNKYHGSETNIIIPDELENGLVVISLSGDLFSEVASSLKSLSLAATGVDFIPSNFVRDCVALESVALTNNITSIGSFAFQNCISLSAFGMPSMTTELHQGAFQNCRSLESMYLNNVEVLWSYVFDGCTSLSEIVPGNSLKEIYGYAFQNTAVKELSFPDGLDSVRPNAFTGSSLTRIEFPNTVTYLDHTAFDGLEGTLKYVRVPTLELKGSLFDQFTALESVEFPEGLLTINKVSGYTDTGTFEGCISLPEVTLPDSLTAIGGSVFRDCASLASVRFGCSLQEIGAHAFYGTALTHVYLPASVTTIGKNAFPEGCVVYCAPGSATYDTLTNAGYTVRTLRQTLDMPADLQTLGARCFAGTKADMVDVPEGCVSIGSRAFADMKNLLYVELPASLEYIAPDAFSGSDAVEFVVPAGSYAEAYCLENGLPVVSR